MITLDTVLSVSLHIADCSVDSYFLTYNAFLSSRLWPMGPATVGASLVFELALRHSNEANMSGAICLLRLDTRCWILLA